MYVACHHTLRHHQRHTFECGQFTFARDQRKSLLQGSCTITHDIAWRTEHGHRGQLVKGVSVRIWTMWLKHEQRMGSKQSCSSRSRTFFSNCSNAPTSSDASERFSRSSRCTSINASVRVCSALREVCSGDVSRQKGCTKHPTGCKHI